MLKIVRTLVRDTRAATAIEYGLILAMVVIAMVGTLSQLASVTTSMWNNVSSDVLSAH